MKLKTQYTAAALHSLRIHQLTVCDETNALTAMMIERSAQQEN